MLLDISSQKADYHCMFFSFFFACKTIRIVSAIKEWFGIKELEEVRSVVCRNWQMKRESNEDELRGRLFNIAVQMQASVEKKEAEIWKEQWKIVPWWNRRAWKRRREIATQSSASLLMQGTFGKRRERWRGVREGGRCGEGIEIVRPGFKHTAILQRMMNWIQMQFSCWINTHLTDSTRQTHKLKGDILVKASFPKKNLHLRDNNNRLQMQMSRIKSALKRLVQKLTTQWHAPGQETAYIAYITNDFKKISKFKTLPDHL